MEPYILRIATNRSIDDEHTNIDRTMERKNVRLTRPSGWQEREGSKERAVWHVVGRFSPMCFNFLELWEIQPRDGLKSGYCGHE